jgi:hypothetical protein
VRGGYALAIETKLPLKDRLQALFTEYGPVALVIHFTIFGLSLAAFSIAVARAGPSVFSSLGIEVEAAAGTAGTLALAYAATKVVQPIRMVVTLALTPFVGRFVRRFRKPQS